MDCNCLHFARRESKENPLKRKMMALVHEEPELQPKEKPVKRRRRETEGKDVKTEKIETCVGASCSVIRSKSKENPLKRKRMDVPHEGPEPQSEGTPGKRRRREAEEKDVKTEKTETCVKASCSIFRRESKENPLKRKMMDLVHEEPELQPKEKPVKRRRRETEGKDVKTEKIETCVEASCSVTRRESQENPRKRKRMDVPHEGPEPQSEGTPGKRRRRETEEKDVKAEKTETCLEATCSVTGRGSKENPLKRKRMDVPHEGPDPQPEEKAERRRRTETEKNDVKTESRANFFSRYILGSLLGKGGFGSVYTGVRKSDGKKVALKFMLKYEDDPYITLPGDTRRLPVEVALMELVCKPPRSPYVIELLEWFETPRSFILVLERPDPCTDLYKYCEDVNMSESLAQIIMQQVIHAACHCCDRGVLHRDIKEENILLNPQTLEVKLIDFGCGDLHKDTPYTEYAGTRTFHPPEWIVEKKYEAEPATVWGLGILLYNLLCGEEPFYGAQEIVNGRLNFPDDLSEACCSLIRWCLQRNPKRRPTLEQILAHDWF